MSAYWQVKVVDKRGGKEEGGSMTYREEPTMTAPELQRATCNTCKWEWAGNPVSVIRMVVCPNDGTVMIPNKVKRH